MEVSAESPPSDHSHHVVLWQLYCGFPTGPVVKPWGETTGRSGSVGNLCPVKAYARGAGFDAHGFSNNIMRTGFCTSAAEHGASVWKMMHVSRHKPVDTLRGYVRRVDLFKEYAGAAFL
jgi:hypothetical protein